MIDLNEVEIFAKGTWNGFKFVVEDLEEIAKNSNELLAKGTNKPPLKLGHSKKQVLAQDDGQPALGWLENFKVKGEKLVADLKNIPDVLHKAIKNKLYKTVSIELKHIQEKGWVASGLAILGADLPAVKTLSDLEMFLSDETQNKIGESVVELAFSEPLIFKEEIMDTKQIEALQKDIENLKREKEQLEKERQIFLEKERLQCFREARQEFLKQYKQDVKNGKLIPSALEKIEKSIDSQQVNFSSESRIVLDSELMQVVLDGYREAGGLFSEQAESKQSQETEVTIDNIENKVVEGINKVIAQTGKNYSEASTIFFSANPEMEKKYFEHGCKISFGV